MIKLYQTLLQKEPKDYVPLIDLLVNTRITDEYKTLAVMRDRGQKADYVQTYYYDIWQIINIVNENSEKGTWFASFYLSWLLYETDVTQNNLSISFKVLCLLVEDNLYRRIIENNRYECYGFCMSLLTILDKCFILKSKDDKRYVLLKLAQEGIVSYIYYHKGINLLWDAEILSSYARLFDRYLGDMTMILTSSGIGSYAQYSYCFGMYEAFKCCPVECEYKIEYHKNALMMQQNQTVVGVTGDAMDASFWDAISIGEEQFLSFTIRMLQYNIVKGTELQGIQSYIEQLNLSYNERIKKEKGFENIKCLERFFQIEPYDKYGYIKPPYKRTSINFKKILKDIGVEESSCAKRELSDGTILLRTEILSLYPQFHQWHDSNKIDNSLIIFVRLIIRDDESTQSISILGVNMYELYIDVSRTGLFFDIPCVVGVWEPDYTGGMNHLLLFVGTNYDAGHGFNNNNI